MIAITVAKNEGDVIWRTVRHLVEQGCRVVVADNMSADGTGIVAGIAGAVVVKDEDPAHRQGAKMTALAERYADDGEFVVPFDADELWWNLNLLTDDIDVATAHPHVHVGERRLPGQEPHPKAAFRWRTGCRIDEGNHYVFGAGPVVADGVLEVCHYQWRALGQIRRKVTQGTAALDAAGMGQTTGTHWRDLAALTDTQLAAWWDDYTHQPTIECSLADRCMTR